MKVSVVMATYNGEPYVTEQLTSIYQQTRSPDEVIICDDGSCDRTAELIRSFISERSLSNWSFIVNTPNKGWQRNFVEALGLASGDYIFFSDQDDVWYLNKIELMTGIMEKNEKIQCLSGRMTTIDSQGEVFQGKNVFTEGNGTNRITEFSFSPSFNTITLLGCTMCIRRRLADLVVKLKVKDYGHDAQCCRLGAIMSGTYLLDRPVIYYRLHDNNTSGVVSGVSFGSANLKKRSDDMEKNIKWLERVEKTLKQEEFFNEEKQEIVRKAVHVQKERYRFLTKRSVIRFIRLFRYRRFYSGLPMYFGDFAYAYHINQMAGKVLWFIKNRKIKGE